MKKLFLSKRRLRALAGEGWSWSWGGGGGAGGHEMDGRWAGGGVWALSSALRLTSRVPVETWGYLQTCLQLVVIKPI